MEILKGIEVIGKALWLPKQKVLIIADLHIGYEEDLNSQGVLIPRTQFNDMKREIEELLKKIKPNTIIVNGDVKHEFGEISRQEWRETLEILDILIKNSKKLILIKGNHDNMLEPIIKKRGLKLKKFYCINKEVCVLHGDKIPINDEVHKAKIIIIGHEHPSISLREGMKTEKYKCFLLGDWHWKKLIIMPSFFPYIEGFDVRNEDRISVMLKQKNIDDFEVFVIGDKIYKFGKVRDLKGV